MMSTYGLERVRLSACGSTTSIGKPTIVSRPAKNRDSLYPAAPAGRRQGRACYLRGGRPRGHTHPACVRADACAVRPLAASSAIRHIIAKHARTAGISAPFLGSHVLRHSHAARQIDIDDRRWIFIDQHGAHPEAPCVCRNGSPLTTASASDAIAGFFVAWVSNSRKDG